jgi:hypothetical protein
MRGEESSSNKFIICCCYAPARIKGIEGNLQREIRGLKPADCPLIFPLEMAETFRERAGMNPSIKVDYNLNRKNRLPDLFIDRKYRINIK